MVGLSFDLLLRRVIIGRYEMIASVIQCFLGLGDILGIYAYALPREGY